MTNDGCYVSPNTNTAQNAFWEAILGKEVNIYIQNQGEDTFKILQVDQFFIIAEHAIDGFVMINKSAIVTVIPPDTSTPDIIKSLAEGVRKISYKPNDKRIEYNKKKLNKSNYKNNDRNYDKMSEEKLYKTPTPATNVQITVKPKRKLIQDGQSD